MTIERTIERDVGRELAQCVEDIAQAFEKIRAVMSTPDSVPFSKAWPSLERLEMILSAKTTVDAAFAYIAERDDAGREVGSSQAHDYLTARLRISDAEAWARLRDGHELFSALEQPTATESKDLDAQAVAQAGENSSSDDIKAKREELERAEQERLARERAEYKAEQQRRDMMLRQTDENKTKGTITASVLNMIERELEHVSRNAVPGKLQLRSQAVMKAGQLSQWELQQWLREEIRKANRHSMDIFGRRDLGAARAKRRFKISRPDSDGGVFVSGYLDAATAALLKTAFAPARNTQMTREDESLKDERTYTQRMADQFEAVLKGYLAHGNKQVPGLGTLVITTTLKEIEELTADSKLPTSAGIDVSPLDLFRLGAARHDYVCVVDEKGLPLELGRAQRTANTWQKLALAASELVCTHPECSRAWAECDVHHIQAWIDDGPTDIHNLTLLCRRHHVDNDDSRLGRRNMGHAQRCPETGRVGHRPAGSATIYTNESVSARKAAGRKLVDRSLRESG